MLSSSGIVTLKSFPDARELSYTDLVAVIVRTLKTAYCADLPGCEQRGPSGHDLCEPARNLLEFLENLHLVSGMERTQEIKTG